MRRCAVAVLFVLSLASPALAQDHVLCNTTPPASFTVTSGAPFTVTWLMPDTATENGVTVPNRFDGFYLQIDGGPKTDIGKAQALTACSAGSQKPADVPYTYRTPSGVSRGSHTLRLSAWSFTLDGNGAPTTTKQESLVSQVPFAAGDPILYGPPVAPGSITITK